MWRLAVVLALVGCHEVFELEPPARDASAPDADTRPLNCPPSYNVPGFGGTRYRVGKTATQIGWTNAQGECKRDQLATVPPEKRTGYTHLVVIATEAERLHVSTTASGSSRAWVGLSEMKNLGSWLWVTAEVTDGYPLPAQGTMHGWQPGEPNDTGRCVMIRDTDEVDPGMFDTQVCGDGGVITTYVCECDDYETEPMNF